MPRVENQGYAVRNWCRATGEGSSAHDVCLDHFEQLVYNPNRFNRSLRPEHPGEPQGEEGWGGDVAHPCYDDDTYTCRVCGRRLTEETDG